MRNGRDIGEIYIMQSSLLIHASHAVHVRSKTGIILSIYHHLFLIHSIAAIGGEARIRSSLITGQQAVPSARNTRETYNAALIEPLR
jgi:hypothetical protein